MATLQPPLQDRLVDAKGQPSQAWTRHQQDVVDRLDGLTVGVTDGTDAAAGQVGEYLTANVAFPGTGLAGGGAWADVISLSLTAGDWDVSGSVIYISSGANLTSVAAGLGTVSATPVDPGVTAIVTNVGTTRLATGSRLLAGPQRISQATAVTAYLCAAAQFPAGTASAYGEIRARRVR